MTTITSTDLRNKSIGLYTPPFRFDHGYIWDAKGQMVADNHVDGEDAVLRVRGWGRISYMENPEALQDEVGNVIALAMTEFWERRKAEKDSEPVAWLAIYHGEVYDEAIGITRSVVEAQADHFGWESALTEIIPLYRHAQQPVVPDRSIFEKWWESQNGAPLDGWDSLRTTDGYCDDGIDGQFEAWNAAMLSGGNDE